MCVATTGALLVAEIALRSMRAGAPVSGDDGGWSQRYRRMNETIYMRSAVDGLVYEPRPSSGVEMEYGWAGFDADGRRVDRGTQPPSAEARVEVAMLGDSLVWSEYLAVDDSLPVQTEHALGSDRYRVSNFGVTGYDTAQEALYYVHRVRPHHPDIVVVVFCMNDLFIASGPYGRFATEAELALKDAQDRGFDRAAPVRRETLDAAAQAARRDAWLELFAEVRAYYLRRTFDDQYVDEYTIATADPERASRMTDALARLGDAIVADGARALLVLSPILDSWDHYHWSEIHELVRAAAERAGFEVVDPLEGWRAQTRPQAMRFPGDMIHYNAYGTGALAEVIARAVHASGDGP